MFYNVCIFKYSIFLSNKLKKDKLVINGKWAIDKKNYKQIKQ